MEVRGGSSVFSAANAVVDHLHDWFVGSDRIVSMGVISEGDYNVPKGLWCSFPVRLTKNFGYEIVKDVPLSEFCHSRIKATI
jgi:malate/lactate dehydrogenase